MQRQSALNENEKTNSVVGVTQIPPGPFACTECGKGFLSRGALQYHTRSHRKDLPTYSCSECDRRFTRPDQLQRHSRVHTGERPYKCTQCAQRFTQKNNLVRHIRCHSGVKPYECNVCGRSFSQLNNMKRHAKTHERSCPICGMRLIEACYQDHLATHDTSISAVIPQNATLMLREPYCTRRRSALNKEANKNETTTQ